MFRKRLIGTKILESGEFENYLGGRQGRERTDSDVKVADVTGWVVRRFICSVLT